MSFYKRGWVYPAELPCHGGWVLAEMGAGPAAYSACGAAALEKDFFSFFFFCLLPSGNVAKLF